MRRHLRIASLTLLLSACHAARDATTSRDASSSPPPDAPESRNASASTAAQRWDDEIGPFIALPTQDSGAVLLLMRDSLKGASVEAEIFSHDDRTVRTLLTPRAAPRCGWTPASLAAGSSSALSDRWAMALAPGIASPLAFDALDDLSPRDSTDITIRVTRVISALAEDSSSAPFGGLPVVVRDAWRARLPDGASVVVAVATRSLNMESNPRSEVVTVVTESESAAPDATWRAAFSRREAGPEDRVEGTDLLSGLLLHGATPVVTLLRDTDRGPVVDFIERTAPMSWHLRWSTASSSCDR
ncbi:MAG: hypothetical protein HYR75_00605 [Gemmatimonadetes bacterium]|nr:hypothetical protein [Gemmatimonadota bacterium]